MENKHWTEFVEENMVEAFIAFIFMLPFIGVGIISSYMIETTLIGDIALGLCTLAGGILLSLKILKGNN